MAKVSSPENYKSRVIDSLVERYLNICEAICVEGPKWCGKTWTSSIHSKSEYLVDDPKNNFSNRMLAELNPSFILQGDTPRMIDEWQEVPSIWDAVRSEIDMRHKKGQIILTGSSTPKSKGILHSGTGRIVSLRMNTMSLFESGDSTGQVSLQDLCNGKLEMQMTNEVPLDPLAYYIVRGGWPENIEVKMKDAHIMPQAYMETVIKEDLSKLDDDTDYNPHKVNLLLKSLARNETTTVSELRLLNDIQKTTSSH